MGEARTKSAELQPVSWSDWKQLFQRLPERMKNNHTLIVAGGVAFYFFLSVFPGIAAIISIYSLLTDLSAMEEQMAEVALILPHEAQTIVKERLKALITDSDQELGWQIGLSILISIWITNVGTRALFQGVNITYGVETWRKSLREIGITLVFTVGGIVFYIVALAVTLGYPAVSDEYFSSGFIHQLMQWIKWPVLAVVLAVALVMVYRFAPADRLPRYRRIFWGAGIATFLWIVGSFILSYGVRLIGVAPSYGPLAAVAILMLWFLLSSFVILLGAEINSELDVLARNKKD